MLQIPFEQLSADALQGLVEEFVTRDGTDYGAEETALEKKISQVRQQLQRGEVLIVYDEDTATTGLVTREQLAESL